MSMQAAQARYDAMTDEHEDDDIAEMNLETLHDALRMHDCDELAGRRYRDCERRAQLIRDRITELEMQMIDEMQQLKDQYESAKIAAEKLYIAAFETPNPAIVNAYFEARDARDRCDAELQKALWLAEAVAA